MTTKAPKLTIKPRSSYTVYDHGDGDETMKHAMHADAMYSFIWDLLQELRTKTKYNEDETSLKYYEEIRAMVHRGLKEEGIDDLF